MIFGTDEDTIEAVVVSLLAQHSLRAAVLETNTGGELTQRLTSVPGGFDILSFSLNTAADRIDSVLPCNDRQNPLLSCEGAELLAKQIRAKAGSDIGVAVIGDEDPDVGPYSKQAGNTYVGLCLPDKTASKHILLGGISKYARVRITSIVLDMLRRQILRQPAPGI